MLNAEGRRFVNELGTRDKLSAALLAWVVHLVVPWVVPLVLKQ